MTNKEKIDFYKELFSKEDARRSEIYNSLNIPIAAFSGLVSFMYYMVSKFNYRQESFLTFVFIGLVCLLGISLLIALLFIVRAYANFLHKYKYTNISYAEKLFEYNNSLIAYHKQYSNNAEKGDEEFDIFLVQKYARLADDNYFTNEVRSRYVYWAKQFIVISIIVSSVCIVPFAYNKITQTQAIEKSPSSVSSLSMNDSVMCRQIIDLLSRQCRFKSDNVISIYNTCSHHACKTKASIEVDTNIVIKDTCIKFIKTK